MPAPSSVPIQEWEIVDYMGKSSGAAIPQWAQLYLSGGETALESLPESGANFLFIASDNGDDPDALNQWQQGFDPELDFPLLASARVGRRFFNAANGRPELAYGGYYEALVRAVANAEWTGVRRFGDFWIERRRIVPQAPGADSSANDDLLRWDCLILLGIDKSFFVSQMEAIFNTIKLTNPASKAQLKTAHSVAQMFFDNF